MNPSAPLCLLLVEDSTAQARFIQQTLRDMESPARFEVEWVDGLERALDRLETSTIDLVLLDLVLPDSDGIATFVTVHDAHPRVPIIVLSGAGDESVALQAVAAGAQDYLAKGSLSPELLARSIRYAMERHRTLEELRRVALVDELTGVYNRRGFRFLAEQHLAVARRTGTPITVLFVDVDGLKRINDTYGHEVGDRVLAEVAELMTTTFRASDVIGRVGGDEFCAFLLNDPTSPSSAESRLRAALDARNARPDQQLVLSCSIGATNHRPDHCSTIAALLGSADQAMYDQKNTAHRARILVVDDDPSARASIARLLGEEFDVVVTGSGRAAVELARRSHPSVVLLDLGLLDVDGTDVAAELRARPETCAIPVVVVTADDRTTTELAAFRAGATAFVAKPIDAQQLRRSIDRALGRVVTRADAK